MAIVGDLLHSRVLRSNVLLLTKLGADVWLCGPPTLMPPGIERLGVRVSSSVDEAVADADVIMMLRIQQERMQGAFFPSLREYYNVFGMTRERVKLRQARRHHHASGSDEPRRRDRVRRGRWSVLGDSRAGRQRRVGADGRAVSAGGRRRGDGLDGEAAAAGRGRVVDPANGRDGHVRRPRSTDDRIVTVGSGHRRPGTGATVVDDAGRAGDLPGPDRHARPPARARPGAQGNRGHRHRGGRRRRIHRGRVHAEHVAGQRQRRRDRLHPAKGGRGAGSPASIRSAPCRADRKASSWPTSPNSEQAGCVAITDDGHPVATALLMRRALEYTRMFDMPVIEHCEDQTLKGDGVAHEGFQASSLGLRGIPGEAESIMALRDISLAELTGGAVHIAHMSARQTLDAVRYGKARGVKVTCEVTPHHFVLTDEMLAAPVAYDTNTKMNPPLRETADRDAMLQGLADGSVDVIATDHAPHHYDEKQVEFDQAPFGITGLETAVSLCFDRLVHRRRHHAAAADRAALGESRRRILRVPGRLAVGGRAGRHHDPGARPRRSRSSVARMRSRSKNTPFDGWRLRGGVAATIVGGRPSM